MNLSSAASTLDSKNMLSKTERNIGGDIFCFLESEVDTVNKHTSNSMKSKTPPLKAVEIWNILFKKGDL